MEQMAWVVKRAKLEGANSVAAMRTHLEDLTWPRFLSELHDALPPEVAERLDENEWIALKQRVREYAQRQLRRLPP